MEIDFHTLHLEIQGKSLLVSFANEHHKEVQSAVLGRGLIPEIQPKVSRGEDFKSLTLSWPGLGEVCFTYIKHDTGIEYRVDWLPVATIKTLVDTFPMAGSHWYGAAQIRHQLWPIEKWSRAEMAFVAGDSFKDQYGGVQERYWLSSSGFSLYVSQQVPLFITMNHKKDQTLSLISKWNSPYHNVENESVKMSYQVFISYDVVKTHQLATRQVFSPPTAIPDEAIFTHPIWSTWARYKKGITQESVLAYAKEIKDHGFKAAQIEIDDDWTTHYGDMHFDRKKFPQPEAMMETLRELGFRATLWVHPFCSPMSKASSQPHWIKSGALPGHTIWWDGIGKILDVTKPSAVEWFKNELINIKEKYKLASFKFDAGEVNWLPPMARPENCWKNPNVYTTKYAEMCYECDKDNRALEVRVGLQTQHLPIFVRMMDKESKWGYNNGLKSLIPHALTFSILGYPFILPDMIGGNAYGSSGMIGSSSGLPDPELFVRWLQANVFLPALQFSISPWQYDEEVLNICKRMTQLHEKYAETIIRLANESVETGAPIIRPLWWVAPCDEEAQVIDDQFMLGDDVLVAPVLEKGAVYRDIYLPPGTWYDELRGRILDGEKWYRHYEARLHELPYFTRHTHTQESD